MFYSVQLSAYKLDLDEIWATITCLFIYLFLEFVDITLNIFGFEYLSHLRCCVSSFFSAQNIPCKHLEVFTFNIQYHVVLIKEPNKINIVH